MIFKPPVFFLPDFRESVGLPVFPPMPGLFPLGLRDKVGLFGAPEGFGKVAGASGSA